MLNFQPFKYTIKQIAFTVLGLLSMGFVSFTGFERFKFPTEGEIGAVGVR
jgi:hypothetical protein